MANLQEYLDLQEQLTSVSSQLERSEGRLEALRERLEKEFGVKTEEKAKTLLGKITKELAESEEALEEAKATFQKKWGAKLNG